MAEAPQLQGAEYRAAENGVRVWGIGVPGYRVDIYAGGGERDSSGGIIGAQLLGAGPVEANTYFNFSANYARLPRGSYYIQARQTNGSNDISYWSQAYLINVA